MFYNFKVSFLNIFIILVLLFFSSELQAQKQRRKSKGKASTKKQGGKKANETENLFFEGLHYFLLERPEKSLVYFLEYEKKDNQSSTVFYIIARIYLELNQYDKSLVYIQKALKLEEDNIHYYDILLEIRLLNGEYDETLSVYDLILNKVKDPPLSYYLQYSSIASSLGNHKKALEIIEVAEKEFGWNTSLMYQKLQLYKLLKEYDNALIQGEKLIKNYPYITEYKLSQAQLLLDVEKYDETEILLNDLLKNNAEEELAQFLLCKLYNEQNKTEKAENIALQIFNKPNFNIELKLVLFFLLENYGYQTELLAEYTKIMAKYHPDSDEINILNATSLQESDPTSSRYHYKKSLAVNGDRLDIWYIVLELDFKLNQYDSLILDANNAIEYFPNNSQLYLFLGNGHLILKNYKKAKESLEFGKSILLNTSGYDSSNIKQFNSLLADIYYQLELYDKAFNTYQEILNQDEDNIHALNNYSYYLSLKKQNLNLAKTMSKKLIDLEPNSPTYLDTHGWVLYQSDNFKEALIYLEKAVKLDTDSNYVILDHLADVLFKLDQKERAIKLWKKSLDLAEPADQLDIKKKLDTWSN